MTIGPWSLDGGMSQSAGETDSIVISEKSQMTDSRQVVIVSKHFAIN